MANQPNNEGKVIVRATDGTFYQVPKAELEKHALSAEQCKTLLPGMNAGRTGGAMGSGPGGGGGVVINVNLPQGGRGVTFGSAGAPPAQAQGEKSEAGTGAVSGYGFCASCYRSCYRSCYKSCYRSCYRSCCGR